jgi:hypothetical protein
MTTTPTHEQAQAIIVANLRRLDHNVGLPRTTPREVTVLNPGIVRLARQMGRRS